MEEERTLHLLSPSKAGPDFSWESMHVVHPSASLCMLGKVTLKSCPVEWGVKTPRDPAVDVECEVREIL